MARKPRTSKGKSMKPYFFVFCEGQSEMAYVKLLRSTYRTPIEIVVRKSDSNISEAYIERCKRDYVVTKNDRTFLMFDLDVDGMLDHLKKLKNAELIVCNPCIELWFLLHYADIRTSISSAECMNRLKKFSPLYEKGKLGVAECETLIQNLPLARERALRLSQYKNPSSTIYILTDALANVR